MKNDLVETVNFCFTDNIISQLSILVNETEPKVERVLHKSVPLVIDELLGQAARGAAPATLLNLAREANAANALAHLTNATDTSWHARGANLLPDLLGDNYRSTVNRVAVAAGVRPTTSSTLLRVAATAVLGVLGKLAAEKDLTPPEFVPWLQAQKDAIARAMLPVPRAAAGPHGPGPSPALAGHEMVRRPTTGLPRAPVQMAPPRDEPGGLPPGAPQTGHFLFRWQWAAAQVDSVNQTKGWINFDRVNFDPGQATLTPESVAQLRNTAGGLRTFSTAVVKIGGYTDSTGPARQNLQLSEEQARSAIMALASLGVSLERLQAKGYGPRYFVAPNSTPANRSLNRRVSIRVLKK
ncbi:OmpA family protein [Hymenobacter sp.]|uniref:OmpA family protein n=1 Tax=Hymenobacter sp. TaxID=1898978 RepID=UPI00286AC587|nr:OmpA family protein [Hymenobacter sp.]